MEIYLIVAIAFSYGIDPKKGTSESQKKQRLSFAYAHALHHIINECEK